MNDHLLAVFTPPLLALFIGLIAGHEFAILRWRKRQTELAKEFTDLHDKFAELSSDLLRKDGTRAGIDIGTEYVLNLIDHFIIDLREKLQ